MVQKYIIDKTDIHDLLTGQELPLSQGKARAFCIEIAGELTNGDLIKAMFPNAEIQESMTTMSLKIPESLRTCDFDKRWWNTSYRKEQE